MLRKTEMLPSFIGLLLISGFCFGMQGLMSETGREWYPVVPLRLEQGVDMSYRGQYHQDPRFVRLLADMPTLRREALAAAQRRMGITTDDPDGFAIRFKDTLDYGAASQPVRGERRDLSLVSLSAEQAVLGVMDIRGSMIHEFIHCLMRVEMGDAAYLALPVWVREGLAVWGAGQLEERTRNLVAGTFMDVVDGEALGAPLGDLSLAWLRTDSYLLDALTFEWLAQTQGEAAVRSMVAELLAGADPEQALQRASGLHGDAVFTAQRRFARRYFEGVLLASGLEEFRLARRALDAGDRLRALAWLNRLVTERGDSVLVPMAWYRIGLLAEDIGWDQRAAEAYAQVVGHHSGQLGLQADSHLRLADCLLRLGRYELAAQQGERFLELHPRAHWTQRRMANRLVAARAIPLAAGVHAP